MIVTTKSTPEKPYIYISGNKEKMNIPCAGVPLLIGSELDWHFQSLLPEREELVMNEDNFPPLRRVKKTESEIEIKKSDPKPTNRQLKRCRHGNPPYNLTHHKNLKAICPN